MAISLKKRVYFPNSNSRNQKIHLRLQYGVIMQKTKGFCIQYSRQAGVDEETANC